jgi:hypothetical protein
VNWYCPRCDAAARTVDAKIPWHNCPGLAGLSVALVQEGVSAKVEAVERQDYVGGEDVQLDGNGRPVMAVVTTRDHGNDVAVYAPTATLKGD